ncbi:MAG TPA: hypothetical protein VN758_08120 [Solirubrobacterales bacterium]|nr:hypothetical protein [Solirubrobacterales bacterium]
MLTPRPAASLYVAILAAALLTACGGGTNSSSSSSETGPLRITGGGSGQFRERGADNSIEEYGHEASRSELEQAASDVHSYLVARVEEDWTQACTYFSKDFRKQLEEEAPHSEQVAGKGCAATVDAYLSPVPRSERYESSKVEAGSLRVKGDTGFIFFNAAAPDGGHKLYMAREDGSWRIGGNLYPTSLH